MAAIVQLLGVVSVTTGAALIDPAAGFIAGGFFLVLIGIAIERSKNA